MKTLNQKRYAHGKNTSGSEKLILIALIMIAVLIIAIIILNSPDVICGYEKMHHIFDASYICSLYQVMP